MRAGDTSHCPETSLEDEIASLGDDGVFDMANLSSRQTAIDGVVFISTAMEPHGPRVKYFVKAGKGQSSFSVSITPAPQVLASSLPARVVNEIAPQVIAWVALNREELLAFWNEGETWMCDEVQAFIGHLKKVEG